MRSPALAVAAVLSLFLCPPARAAEPEGGPYYAETTFSFKHRVGLDRVAMLLRPPWEAPPSGRGIVVAVVDTGIDPSHPDLAGALAGWRDLVGGRPGPYDDNGHGTHVAGILAGRGHFQPDPLDAYWLTGIRGVAPGARLLVVKAMNETGVGTDESVAAAILWALDPDGDGNPSDGAQVINLSVGIDPAERSAGRGVTAIEAIPAGPRTRRAVERALDLGVAVLVASGNDGSGDVAEPGNVPGVLAVGALAGADVAPFSNGGSALDLVAPGVLLSAYPRALDGADGRVDGYAGMAGTSMAAPVVAGVVALLLEADPSLRGPFSTRAEGRAAVEKIGTLLVSSARVLEGVGRERQGAGALDAYGALSLADRGTGGDTSPARVAVLAALAAVGAIALARGALRLRRAATRA